MIQQTGIDVPDAYRHRENFFTSSVQGISGPKRKILDKYGWRVCMKHAADRNGKILSEKLEEPRRAGFSWCGPGAQLTWGH